MKYLITLAEATQDVDCTQELKQMLHFLKNMQLDSVIKVYQLDEITLEKVELAEQEWKAL